MSQKTPKPTPKKRKATKAVIAQRVEEVLRIRLDGAEFWDLLQYIAEKQQQAGSIWATPDAQEPFAERTVWWYVQKADERIAESFRNERGRKRLLRRHLAQRRNLYAKAVSQGDIRAALACLDSQAKLAGLFDDELNRLVADLQRQIAEIKAHHGNGNAPKNAQAASSRSDGPPPPGAAGDCSSAN
jgi:hypothetical protein